MSRPALALVLSIALGCGGPDPDPGPGGDPSQQNHPPEVALLAPSADGRHYADVPVRFEAVATDHEDPPEALVVSFTSSLDGELDLPATPDAEGRLEGTLLLSEGAHLLTARVVDTRGSTGEDQVEIAVGPANTPPSCAFVWPDHNGQAEPGSLVLLQVEVSDPDEPVEDLWVAFASDLDGPLGEAVPDAEGLASIERDDLSVGTHILSVEVVDEVGGSCVDAIAFTLGSPPSAEIVTPLPGAIHNEDQAVLLTGQVSDLDWAPEELLIRWTSSLDGLLDDTAADESGWLELEVADLSVGEHDLVLRAEDPTGFYAVDTVTFRVNGLPSAPEVAIVPGSPQTGDDLVVNITTEATDPDGDTLSYLYVWTVDGEATEHDSDTVPAEATTRGQSWQVTVQATDGHGFGPPTTAEVTVVNTPPVADGANILPDPAITTDTLTCEATGEDADGDEVSFTYAWTVEGEPAGEGSELEAEAFVKGQTVVCTATPSDGFDEGAPVSASLEIQNSLPALTSVTLNTDAPSKLLAPSVVSVAPEGTAADPDGDAVTYAYDWYVGGSLVAAASGHGPSYATLSASHYEKGETIHVVVHPSDDDGDSYGSPATSETVTVVNSPPALTSVTLNTDAPSKLLEPSVVSVAPEGAAADPDGDAVTYAYDWYVGGSLVAAASGHGPTFATLSASHYAKGETIHVVVHPSDDGGSTYGTPATSATLTVVNSPPSAEGVVLTPIRPREGDLLVAELEDFTDPDGDAEGAHVYSWLWQPVGGDTWIELPEVTDQLDLDDFEVGDAFFVEVIPTDSEGAEGEVVVSEVVEIHGSEVSLGAGSSHTCAVRTDGTLWCWGRNVSAQLGDGTTTDRLEPVQVGAEVDWEQVSGGGQHTCGLRRNGTVWCWGQGSDGQLGVGATSSSHTPVQVGADTTWDQVSAGGEHTCATRTDGTLWCWGNNGQGRLGDGTTTQRNEPVQVGTVTTWAQVSAGRLHTCATRTDGSLWCWGTNWNGRLGDGTTTPRNEPVQVGTATAWAQVSAGGEHTCATRTDGALWCWGRNDAGGLGDGTTTERHEPVQVGSDTTWEQVSVGSSSTCATRTDDTLWCWGHNGSGRLGDGTLINHWEPVQAGVDSDWARVSMGDVATCAVRHDERISCWGGNLYGRTGHGPFKSSLPELADEGPWPALMPGSFGAHGCAVDASGGAWCWGRNSFGQLGDGSIRTAYRTTETGPGAGWGGLATGTGYSCGTRTDGTLWCWGANSTGQLGDGTTTERHEPVQVGSVNGWAQVSASHSLSWNHTCATRTDGTLWCWGHNGGGQLGDGTTIQRTSPVEVDNDDEWFDWAQVSAGHHHTCATGTNGTLWCWGSNGSGRLGDGTTTQRNEPVQVGTGATWAQVSTGAVHTCATRTDGTLWCWGNNGSGRLGDGTTTERHVPVQVGTAATWDQVSAGLAHTCATRTDGTLWCWGANESAQLGDGSTTDRISPVQIGADVSWSAVSLTTKGALALDTEGRLWSWGYNEYGELARGGTYIALSPREVLFPDP